MRRKFLPLVVLLALPLYLCQAQNTPTVPTFKYTIGQSTYALLGNNPSQGKKTTIPTVLVPITLAFESKQMDASPDVRGLLSSPIFAKASFPSGGHTQYADAMLRSTFPAAKRWHTLLGKPQIKPVTIAIPAAYGYVLTSKKTGTSFAVADIEYVQRQLFKQLPRQDGKLVIAITHNTTFYTWNDDTLCCSWGTHGVDAATGNSFVLGSYLSDAPAVVKENDVQPLTQQLAEFINDPLHDPLYHGNFNAAPGNQFPPWMRPASMHPGDMGRCGGSSAATAYFLLEPTDTNPKNNFPDSEPFTVRIHRTTYHLQNVALLPWYTGAAQGLGSTYSFPNAQTLSAPAAPCPAHREQEQSSAEAVAAIPEHGAPNGHKLIGYWTGSRFSGGKLLPLRDVSPQWDIILVAFASPDKSGPEGTLRFKPPVGITPEQLKSDIAYLKRRGKKVMISLGGGGQYFTLDNRSSVPTFVHCVTQIVSEYGFDGIDLDFEAPSLELDPGDTDFRHPQTPSTVNLIAALRELHNHFGPGFMISLVPEGSQIPAGYPTYGGQFGSYLPLTYAIRDILSFIDVQSYNTPPLEGLDGEIYQPNTVDYHAAMTDLLLNGFDVGGNPDEFFPPLPANKVAIGFLIGDTTPTIVSQAMSYIITGHAPAGTTYKLREPQGYPGMIGAMFWTIDADQQGNYLYSNVIGPQLHNYPPSDQK